MGVITDREMQVKPAAHDLWLTESAPRGAGRFLGRITQAGERGFYFRYTTSTGARDTLAIGSYHPRGVGGLTVAQAREKASEWSRLYQSGIKDLRQHFEQLEADRLQAAELERQRIADEQRQLAEAQARRLTVRQVFERWRATDLQPIVHANGKRSGRKDGGQMVFEQFTRHVFPLIGDRPLEDVRKADLLAVIDAQKGKARTAAMLLGDLKQMLAFALDRELIAVDPLATVKKSRIVGTPTERERVLAEEEIRLLPEAIAQARLNPRSAIAIWLMLATGVRIGELTGAIWAEDLPSVPKARNARIAQLQTLAEDNDVKLGLIDLQARTWHLLDTKNQRDHTIHLSAFACQQIEALRQHREALIDSPTAELTPWVFPATDNARPVCVKSLGKQLVDRQREPEQRMAGRSKATTALMLPGGKWTAHDLRRTAATLMARLGFSSDVINECLSHVQTDKMARVYIQDRREADQRRAFDALGQRLQELLTQTKHASNVVPLKAA